MKNGKPNVPMIVLISLLSLALVFSAVKLFQIQTSLSSMNAAAQGLDAASTAISEITDKLNRQN